MPDLSVCGTQIPMANSRSFYQTISLMSSGPMSVFYFPAVHTVRGRTEKGMSPCGEHRGKDSSLEISH